MNFRLTIVATFFAATMATSALAQNSLENCPVVMSQTKFESEGGKLIVTKPPNLVQLPPGFPKTCHGGAGLEFVAHPNGSIGGLGMDHNTLGEGLSLNDSLNCGTILMDHVLMMRYAPVKLKEKPVCVLFNFNWTSQTPDELTRWDYTYGPEAQRKETR